MGQYYYRKVKQRQKVCQGERVKDKVPKEKKNKGKRSEKKFVFAQKGIKNGKLFFMTYSTVAYQSQLSYNTNFYFSYMQSPSRLPIESMSNPFVHSLNPSLPDQYSPYNYHNVAQNSSPPNRHSSFKQEGPVQTLNLNDNVSFARNFKSRLYDADPQQELSKHKQQDRYRQELRIQMEDDRRRKAAQKAKDEEEDMKLEKKFYDNIQIEAQKKANKSQEPNYFVMRTAKGHRKHHKGNNSREGHLNRSQIFQASKTFEVGKGDLLRRTLYEPPKIIKRGGYHNQSSLDQPHLASRQAAQQNPQQKQTKGVPHLIVTVNQQENLTRQMAEEQDRISKLLIFQQNMLKKLDYFKRQIYQTTNSLRLDEEYEKVKLRLRAKPINMQKVQSLTSDEGVEDFLNNTDMYRLPVINKHHRKIYEGEREIRKKKKSLPIELRDEPRKKEKEEVEQKQPEIRPRAGSNSIQNDKNFHEPEPSVSPQNQEPEAGVQPESILDQEEL